jgi:hypothetical protein
MSVIFYIVLFNSVLHQFFICIDKGILILKHFRVPCSATEPSIAVHNLRSFYGEGVPVSNIFDGEAHTPLPLGSVSERCKLFETILITGKNTSYYLPKKVLTIRWHYPWSWTILWHCRHLNCIEFNGKVTGDLRIGKDSGTKWSSTNSDTIKQKQTP